MKTMAIDPKIDIGSNRKATKWTNRELVGRLAWGVASPLFRFSPKPLWQWRVFLLRLFGARIGSDVHIAPSVRISIPWNLTVGNWSSIGFDALIYNLGPVVIGERVTISQRTHLCAGTHNHNDPAMPLIKAYINIDSNAWICADAFIGPGRNIGAGAVVAARAVVTKDVAPWKIVAGNPQREIGQRSLGTEPIAGNS